MHLSTLAAAALAAVSSFTSATVLRRQADAKGERGTCTKTRNGQACLESEGSLRGGPAKCIVQSTGPNGAKGPFCAADACTGGKVLVAVPRDGATTGSAYQTCVCPAAGTQIVSNGDFSSGLSGWTPDTTSQCASGDCSATVVDGYYRAYVNAQNNYGAGDPYSKTTLQQTLSTCQGKTYTFSADVTFEYGNAAGAYIQFLIDGNEVAYARGPGSNSVSTTLTGSFTASSSSPVITIHTIVVYYSVMTFRVDNVKVIQQ